MKPVEYPVELCGGKGIYGDTKVFEFYSLILIQCFNFDIIGPGVGSQQFMFEYSTTAIAGSAAAMLHWELQEIDD